MILRWIVGGKAVERDAASTSQMGRFETEWLASEENLAALSGLSGQWIDCVHGHRLPRSIGLNMDSSVSPTHGDLEGTAYNGHFACTCYHPLFVFNQFGDLERSALRPGIVHSVDGWKDVLEPVVARYRKRDLRRYFRADAAFSNPEVYEFLEAEGYKYTIRLQANRILQERIGYLLKRPVGRPQSRPGDTTPASALRRKAGRCHPRRCQGRVASRRALSPRRFHCHQPITSGGTGRRLLQQARDVRAMDQRRQERDQVDAPVVLLVHALASPTSCGRWVVRDARYVVFQMAEVAVPRELFGQILRLIDGLQPRPAAA